jgi:hypothetical protein
MANEPLRKGLPGDHEGDVILELRELRARLFASQAQFAVLRAIAMQRFQLTSDTLSKAEAEEIEARLATVADDDPRSAADIRRVLMQYGIIDGGIS